MTYTPINWQTGDTITAEKMNKMDNGWSVDSTQLFSETVTTTNTGQGYAAGQLAYVFQQEPPAVAVVTFDGTDYVCERDENYAYGGSNDFSTYPFYIRPEPSQTNIYTEVAGTHTVAFGTQNVEVSAGFDKAVGTCVDTSTMPMECVSGTTTYANMMQAFGEGRIMFFRPFSGVTSMYFVTSFSSSGIAFIPAASNVSATFDNDVFTVTINV